MQVQHALEQALALHQSGQLQDAQTIYEAVIRAQPRNPDAFHLLGVLALQTGQYPTAIELIQQAISYSPLNAGYFSNLGLAQQGLQLWDAAVASFDHAIKLKPDYAEAFFNRGLALRALNQMDAAVASFEQSLAVNPDYVDACFNCGLTLQLLNRLEAAIACYDRGLCIMPDNPEVLYNRGLALQKLNQLEAAIASYDRAITLKPDYAEAYSNRGLTLQKLGHLEAAIASYDHAITFKPDYTEAYSNRGTAYQALKQLDSARLSHEQAIAITPEYAFAHSNLGATLQSLNLLDAALVSHQRAIALNPNCAEAFSNLGGTLRALNRLQEAITAYDQAISLKSDYPEAHVNKALAQLLAGEFSSGWLSYEWRWKDPQTGLGHRNFAQPLWRGTESLTGKAILLHAEQGLGDTLQFCRYTRLVKALGAHVILEVPAALTGLLDGLDGVSILVTQGDPLPAFDFHCPLLSLPLAFRTTLANIPSTQRYLQAKEDMLAEWAQKLGPKTTPRIGLAWSGRNDHNNDLNRSIVLSEWGKHLPGGFQYVSLQKEVRAADQAELLNHPEILHFGGEINNFSDTAALCELMDLIISVDTSVAHLGGALGIPTWILLPYSPDWRWLLDREDSPWYPNVKLYRQASPGDWRSVFTHVGQDLVQLLPPSA